MVLIIIATETAAIIIALVVIAKVRDRLYRDKSDKEAVSDE